MPEDINSLKNMWLDRKFLVNHQSFLSLDTKIVKITDIIKVDASTRYGNFPGKIR